MKTIYPSVTLVGAGPGAVDLITVAGLKAIQSANVILYDALINLDLLDEAPNAITIFVGKRKGFKAFEQEEINQLIVDYANLHGHVVRLKGGDSFVFGRGMEELVFAEQNGIATKVIPGLSSSISVPALAGIPVTHRGTSNGFHVLSATLANGTLNPEIENAVKSNSTLVILMGLNKLVEISQMFNLANKGHVPAAVILNGSLEDQKIISAPISDLANSFSSQGTKGPGIIVIGDVVAVKDKNCLIDCIRDFTYATV